MSWYACTALTANRCNEDESRGDRISYITFGQDEFQFLLAIFPWYLIGSLQIS
jgi:hypothetical protein